MKIFLRDVKFHTAIGVFDFERLVGNDFILNLWVEIDTTVEMENDQLEGTLNYADLYDICNKEMSRGCQLIETVCLRIASKIKSAYPDVKSGEIEIIKVAPPIKGMQGSAGVSLLF